MPGTSRHIRRRARDRRPQRSPRRSRWSVTGASRSARARHAGSRHGADPERHRPGLHHRPRGRAFARARLVQRADRPGRDPGAGRPRRRPALDRGASRVRARARARQPGPGHLGGSGNPVRPRRPPPPPARPEDRREPQRLSQRHRDGAAGDDGGCALDRAVPGAAAPEPRACCTRPGRPRPGWSTPRAASSGWVSVGRGGRKRPLGPGARTPPPAQNSASSATSETETWLRSLCTPRSRRRASAREALRLHAQARGDQGLVVGQGDIRRALARRAQLEQEIGHALGARADLKLLDLADQVVHAARHRGQHADRDLGLGVEAFFERPALDAQQARLAKAGEQGNPPQDLQVLSIHAPAPPAARPKDRPGIGKGHAKGT